MALEAKDALTLSGIPLAAVLALSTVVYNQCEKQEETINEIKTNVATYVPRLKSVEDQTKAQWEAIRKLREKHGHDYDHD